MAKDSLDETDLKIIRTLIKTPTIKQSDIARAVSLTEGAVSGRLRKYRERGILCGHRFDFLKVKDHSIFRMFFKLEKPTHGQVKTAVSYFSELEFVICVKQIYGDTFDLVVDYVVFPKDYEPDDVGAEGSDVVYKAQILRDLPVRYRESVRIREFDPAFSRIDYLDLLN